MGRSIALFSSMTITPKGLARVMTVLKASPDEYGWQVSKDGRQVWVEIATSELVLVSESVLLEAAEELGDVPASLIVVIFNDSQDDRFEWRLARAVGMALAEHYPIVWHDYANPAETLYAPGQRPVDEDSRRG